MEDYFETFRENLKYYRMQKKWSQCQLAIQANSSNGMIGNIESGKAKPSFDLIIRLAESLNVNPADLFLRDSSKLQEKEIFNKYGEVIRTFEFISDEDFKAIKTLAKNLAESKPGYTSTTKK